MGRISIFTAALVGGGIIAGAAPAQGVAAGGGGVAAGGNGVAGGGMAVGGQAQYPAAAPMTSPSGAPLTWVDPHQPEPGGPSAPAPSAPAASVAGADTAATAPNSWADVTTEERPSPARHEPGPGSGPARHHAKTSSSRAAISRHERRSAPAS